MDLPKLVGNNKTKIAPIVSSRRATQLILKMWAHRYNRTADFIVIEGPKAWRTSGIFPGSAGESGDS